MCGDLPVGLVDTADHGHDDGSLDGPFTLGSKGIAGLSAPPAVVDEKLAQSLEAVAVDEDATKRDQLVVIRSAQRRPGDDGQLFIGGAGLAQMLRADGKAR